MDRYTVTFGPQSDEVLGRLASQAGTSKLQIVRRALILYNYVHTETQANPRRRLAITEDDVPVKDIVLR